MDTGFLRDVNSLKCTSSVCARKTRISGKIALSLDTNVSDGLVQVGFENVLTLLRVKQNAQPHPNGNITDGAMERRTPSSLEAENVSQH